MSQLACKKGFKRVLKVRSLILTLRDNMSQGLTHWVRMVLFVLFAFPSVAFASPYGDLMGKTVSQLGAEGACNSKWVDSGEKLGEYPLWICPSYNINNEFNGKPAIVIIKNGKVVGSGSLFLNARKNELIVKFLKVKNLINMTKGCTQLNMANLVEQVFFKCGKYHTILTLEEDDDDGYVRLVYLKDVGKNFNSEGLSDGSDENPEKFNAGDFL